jgi:hypothetical protein
MALLNNLSAICHLPPLPVGNSTLSLLLGDKTLSVGTINVFAQQGKRVLILPYASFVGSKFEIRLIIEQCKELNIETFNVNQSQSKDYVHSDSNAVEVIMNTVGQVVLNFHANCNSNHFEFEGIMSVLPRPKALDIPFFCVRGLVCKLTFASFALAPIEKWQFEGSFDTASINSGKITLTKTFTTLDASFSLRVKLAGLTEFFSVGTVSIAAQPHIVEVSPRKFATNRRSQISVLLKNMELFSLDIAWFCAWDNVLSERVVIFSDRIICTLNPNGRDHTELSIMTLPPSETRILVSSLNGTDFYITSVVPSEIMQSSSSILRISIQPGITSTSSVVRLGAFAYNLPITNGIVFLKLPVEFPIGIHDVSVVDSGSEVILKDALSCIRQVKILAVSPSVVVANVPTSVTIQIDTEMDGFSISVQNGSNSVPCKRFMCEIQVLQSTLGDVSFQISHRASLDVAASAVITFIEKPELLSIHPSVGRSSGFTVVTISGTNFPPREMTKCLFDGTIPSVYIPFSRNQAMCVSPPLPLGKYVTIDLLVDSVRVPFNSLNDKRFLISGAMIVESIFPSAGPQNGRTQVEIRGWGFQMNASHPLCHFGNDRTAAHIISDRTARCSTPPGNGSGLVNIQMDSQSTAENPLQLMFTFNFLWLRRFIHLQALPSGEHLSLWLEEDLKPPSSAFLA